MRWNNFLSALAQLSPRQGEQVLDLSKILGWSCLIFLAPNFNDQLIMHSLHLDGVTGMHRDLRAGKGQLPF